MCCLCCRGAAALQEAAVTAGAAVSGKADRKGRFSNAKQLAKALSLTQLTQHVRAATGLVTVANVNDLIGQLLNCDSSTKKHIRRIVGACDRSREEAAAAAAAAAAAKAAEAAAVAAAATAKAAPTDAAATASAAGAAAAGGVPGRRR